MTTVTFKNNILACDSRVSSSEGIVGEVIKIKRLPSGALFAGVGDLAQIQLFERWARGGFRVDGHKKTLEELAEPDYTCVIIPPTGAIREYSDTIIPTEYHTKAYAWGSGAQFARGRMDAPDGTAILGVKTAAKFDPGTGGRIRTLTLEPVCT